MMNLVSGFDGGLVKLVRYTGENTSALYVNGKLDLAGDHYRIDERISQLCNVEEREGDDFFRGGKNTSDVAQSLTEIDDFIASMQDKEAKAEALRQQAAELLRMADEIAQ